MAASLVETKICGINSPEALEAALRHGARYLGFVFYPRSPRNLSVEAARQLCRMMPTGVRSVGLFVDPDDAMLAGVARQVPLDMIQLHGQESPARVAAITAETGLPAIKAIPVATAEDLPQAEAYRGAAAMILFDAKPPAKVASLPGGNGLAFDWQILADASRLPPSWMLSGGLTPETVGLAIRTARARAVDVSSGVESRPGVKDPERIRAFLAAVAAEPLP